MLDLLDAIVAKFIIAFKGDAVIQMQDRIGQILGNYRLIRLIGKGGHAEVYLAEHIYLDTRFAIKILVSNTEDSIEQETFLAEAKFMMQLKHPHIIDIRDYGFDTSSAGSEAGRKTPYFVMEYASHGTLRDLYSHGELVDLPEILSYVKQIAEVLQYAHDQNIINLDVKPGNLLLRTKNYVILSDFGIAASVLNTDNLQKQNTEISEKTARGEVATVSGTAPYLAPERLLGHTQRASDQYSLAVVVYEWLCGKLPFTGSNDEICEKQINELPPSLRAINPFISEEIEQVVIQALSKKPEVRYESVWEFYVALEKAIRGVPTVILRPSPNRSMVDYPTLRQSQALPNEGKPVISRDRDRDTAFVEIAAGIKKLIEKAIANKL